MKYTKRRLNDSTAHGYDKAALEGDTPAKTPASAAAAEGSNEAAVC